MATYRSVSAAVRGDSRTRRRLVSCPSPTQARHAPAAKYQQLYRVNGTIQRQRNNTESTEQYRVNGTIFIEKKVDGKNGRATVAVVLGMRLLDTYIHL